MLRFDLLIIYEILDTIITTGFCYYCFVFVFNYWWLNAVFHTPHQYLILFLLLSQVYLRYILIVLFIWFIEFLILFYFNFLSDFSTKLLSFSIILLIFPLYCFIFSSRSVLIHFSHLLLLSSLRSLIIFIGKLAIQFTWKFTHFNVFEFVESWYLTSPVSCTYVL